MTLEDQKRAEERLCYTFADARFLKEALTHSSAADSRLQSNERMEFLGDAVLDLIICDLLYKKFPTLLEGDLTQIKSAVVSRKICAEVAIEAELVDLLMVGRGISDRSLMPPSLAAAVYESVVAAIYLDGGYDAVTAFVVRTMSPKIDPIYANLHEHNYKAVLQQHSQRAVGGAPVYELLDEKGPDHSKCFEICVVINGRRFPSAWGQTKKTAEQKAALLALEELGLTPVPDGVREL